MLFTVVSIDKPGTAALRNKTRPAHRAFIETIQSKLAQAGAVLGADGEVVGTVVFIEAGDRAEVEQIVAKDPYVKVGLFESVIIGPYRESIRNGVRTN